MNNLTIIGNLTRDPELQTTPNGKSVCKFALAVGRNFKNANGEYDTDFFNVSVWGQQGENAAKYLAKGKKAAVVGSIQFRQYTDQDGVKRNTHDVMADKVEYLSPAQNAQGGANNGSTSDANAMTPVDDKDLPF